MEIKVSSLKRPIHSYPTLISTLLHAPERMRPGKLVYVIGLFKLTELLGAEMAFSTVDKMG